MPTFVTSGSHLYHLVNQRPKLITTYLTTTGSNHESPIQILMNINLESMIQNLNQR